MILNAFEELHCDKLIILGDILYHGPRNPIPEGYAPKEVAIELNKYASKILACRGNCDAEVDQMVLDFPCRADFLELNDNGTTLFCTHGHVYAPKLKDDNLPKGCETAKEIKLPQGSICFYGHTHVTVLEENEDKVTVCNPGSPTLPKDNKNSAFAIYENGKIKLVEKRVDLTTK